MARQFINPRYVREDIAAGLVLGIESVPDGLAQGFLAFVNPVFGLYGYMMGTLTGAVFTSSTCMVVQATGAMSLVVASVPQIHHPVTGEQSLFALTILTGIVMLVPGLLKLGSLIRFVPNAVMTGFVNAVALLIILGQLNDLMGNNPGGSNKIAQAINHARTLEQADLPTLMVGLVTIYLIITLEKTQLKALGLVAAMVAASILVPLFGWDSVAQLNDIAQVPGALPRPQFPDPSLFPPLVIPALSLAFVGLVQGASITKSYANPDGKYPDASGDFVGQGVANLVSGLFQGMPVGGSFSATSLATNAGARSRFANVFAGITMAVAIVLFGPSFGGIAMPAMAGLLIVVGFRTFKPKRVEMVWRTGPIQQVVMGITFICCLLVPLQHAVLVGVAMSLLLYLVQQSNKITVKQWRWQPGELPIEEDPPAVLPANEVTVLVLYGSLFFATAPLVEKQLPEVRDETQWAAVILSLNGADLGSTFLDVLERYAADLRKRDSRLFLAGVSPHARDQLDTTGVAREIGRENIFVQTERVGEAGLQAWDAAHRWLEEQPKTPHVTPEIEVQEPDQGAQESGRNPILEE